MSHFSRRTLLAGLLAAGGMKAQTFQQRGAQPSYDLRTGLKLHRVANAMWDFSRYRLVHASQFTFLE